MELIVLVAAKALSARLFVSHPPALFVFCVMCSLALPLCARRMWRRAGLHLLNPIVISILPTRPACLLLVGQPLGVGARAGVGWGVGWGEGATCHDENSTTS